jgi:hypothetical protein
VEIARSTAQKTGAIAVLWLMAVGISWWSIESEIEAKTKKVTLAASEFSAAFKRHQDARYSLDEAQRRTGSDAKVLEEKTTTVDEASKSLDGARKSFLEAKESTIKFKLPTFPEFEIPTRAAPGILSAIVLALAGYLVFMRERTFRHLALGLRVMRARLREPMDRIGEVLGPRTWWMAPLPRRSGEVVTSEEFACALGWQRPENAARSTIGLFWLALLAIQLRVTQLGVGFLREFNVSPDSGINLHLVSGLQSLYVLIFGISASLAVTWFRPKSVPDGDFDVAREELEARRAALLRLRDAGIVLAFVLLIPRVERIASGEAARLFRRMPRFRKRAPGTPAAGADGLRLNPRSAIVHLAMAGRLVGLRSGRTGAWKDSPAGLAAVSDSRMDRSSVSPIAEFGARRLLAEGSIDAGLQLLQRAIAEDLAFKQSAGLVRSAGERRAKPRRRRTHAAAARHQVLPRTAPAGRAPTVSVRLYDLLAEQAIRGNRLPALSALIDFVQKNELAPALGSRVSTWSEAVKRSSD